MLFQVANWRPHLIIASHPDVGLVGWLAKAFLRVPLVYYPFELYAEEFLRQDSITTRLFLKAERQLLAHGIDALVTQNSLRANVYRTERGSRVEATVIQNFKVRSQPILYGRLKETLGLDQGHRVVLYEGAIQPGRCLENLVKAVQHFPTDTELVLIGGQGEYFRDILHPLAQEVGDGKVHFVPWVPQSELHSLIADADVGIIIYEDRPRNNLFCAPGKLSDYVNAGIPIVASALPTLVPIIRKYGIGECFDNSSPESIADAVIEIMQKPHATIQFALEQARLDLVWETQEPILIDLIRDLLNESLDSKRLVQR